MLKFNTITTINTVLTATVALGVLSPAEMIRDI